MKISNQIVSLILLNSILVIYTMEMITLPSAAEINARLSNLGLQDFVEKTKLDESLAGQQLYSTGIALMVRFAIDDYTSINNSAISRALWHLMPKIIKAILSDHPEQVEELYDFGFIVRPLLNSSVYNNSQ